MSADTAVTPSDTLNAALLQEQPLQAAILLERLANAESISRPRAALLLRATPEANRERVLAHLEAPLRQDLRELLLAPANSAAELMDAHVLPLHPSMLVSDALGRLRGQQFHKRPTQSRRVLLIVDDAQHFLGMVAIQDLAFAMAGERLSDYLQSAPATVQPTATHEEILKVLDAHSMSSLPVVDAEQRLVGIVRQEELNAIVREGAAGDMQAIFGVSREEQALSPPWFSVRQRAPWMQINLFTTFAAAAVVGLFEETIATYTALAVLLPVVAGQASNAGAQALAVVIRGLALHEISLLHWPKLLRKELLVGLLNGLAVALTSALVVYFWSHSFGLATVMALAMVVSMGIAGITGAAVPLLLTRFGQDPAQSSSIVLTTVTDIVGFFSFLGIASLFIASF